MTFELDEFEISAIKEGLEMSLSDWKGIKATVKELYENQHSDARAFEYMTDVFNDANRSVELIEKLQQKLNLEGKENG